MTLMVDQMLGKPSRLGFPGNIATFKLIGCKQIKRPVENISHFYRKSFQPRTIIISQEFAKYHEWFNRESDLRIV